MSERLYERFISLVLGLVLFIIGLLAALFLFVVSWFFKAESMLYAILAAIFCLSIYGSLYLLQIKSFKDNIGLYIPKADPRTARSSDFLDIPDDKALAVCAYYHNGTSLEQIKYKMGLNHNNQVKRYLLKGLDILLKEHQEKKVEE